MAVNDSSGQVKKICDIIEQRDIIIIEKEAKIKYFKNATEKMLNEIKQLERRRNRIKDEDKIITEQINQLEHIEKSLKQNHEVAMKCLLNQHKFIKLLDKDNDIKEKEEKEIQEEATTIYNKAKENLSLSSTYQELQDKKIEFLKLDIQKRDREVKIRIEKSKIHEIIKFKKAIFYNNFVELAEKFLIGQYLVELNSLKIEESEALRKLYILQEEATMRQKLCLQGQKIKRTVNISFSPQEDYISKPKAGVESCLSKNSSKTINEKLTKMLEEEPEKQMIPPKIQILSENVIVPAFEIKDCTEKRKTAKKDFTRKWKHFMKGTSLTRKISTVLSQEKQLSQSQASQQSLKSQKEEHQEPQNSMNHTEQPKLQLRMDQDVASQINDTLQPIQMKMSKTLNNEHQPVNTENLQRTPAIYQEDPQVNSVLEKDTSNATKDNSFFKPNMISEPSKSVRFNLDPLGPKENKGIFGAQSIFGNAVSSFFDTHSLPSSAFDNLAADRSNKMLNISYMDFTDNLASGLEFTSENQSPKYSYDLGANTAQEPFKASESTAFDKHQFKTPEPISRSGGFFAFGKKNTYNPF